MSRRFAQRKKSFLFDRLFCDFERKAEVQSAKVVLVRLGRVRKGAWGRAVTEAEDVRQGEDECLHGAN